MGIKSGSNKELIDFTIGEPDQELDNMIKDSAIKFIRENRDGYDSASGYKELRESLSNEYNVDTNQVTISPGSKWSIYSILYLLGGGGNFILPSPHYSLYNLLGEKLNVKIKVLKRSIENNWDINIDQVSDLIDNKTKFIVITNPDNPTGRTIPEKTLKILVEMANDNNITILSDEVYSDISFKKIKSITEFDGNHIMIGSFSKTFSMTGWRIGFSISSKDTAQKLSELNEMTITSIPLFTQVAALTALGIKGEVAKKMKSIYRKRLYITENILSSSGFKFSIPDSPFYIFPQCGIDSNRFAAELMKKNIAISPGSLFGDYRNYFRLSLTVPDRLLEVGLNEICDTSKKLNVV